jgi:hypothetical protein
MSILIGMWILCSCSVEFAHTLDILAWFCHVNAEAACTQLRLNLVRTYALHPHVHCFVLGIRCLICKIHVRSTDYCTQNACKKQEVDTQTTIICSAHSLSVGVLKPSAQCSSRILSHF